MVGSLKVASRVDFKWTQSDASIHNSPVWSPDGRYITYQAEGGMFQISADGGGKPKLLIEDKNTPFPESFTADNKRLAFSISNPVFGDLDIWTVPLEGAGGEIKAGKPEPRVQTPAHERDAAFSPNGRWLAYMSTTGTYEVYVRAFPGASLGAVTKWQISNGGGFTPVWSSNGRELFYRSADNRIMVVNCTDRGASFAAEKPRVWSETRIKELTSCAVSTLLPTESALSCSCHLKMVNQGTPGIVSR